MVTYDIDRFETFEKSFEQFHEIFIKDQQWHIYDNMSLLPTEPYIVVCNVKNPTILGVITGRIRPVFAKIQYLKGPNPVFLLEGYLWWDKKNHTGLYRYYTMKYDIIKLLTMTWQLILDKANIIFQPRSLLDKTQEKAWSAIIATHEIKFSERMSLIKYNIFG